MAKWIVEATPLLEQKRDDGGGALAFFPNDDAAKTYIRDMTKRHFAVRLSSARDLEPRVHMQHVEALAWANN
jgi:hypothetical protein